MGGVIIRDELMKINQDEVWNSDKIERTEKFIDDFAIGFAEWLVNTSYVVQEAYTTKELLEIYKKKTYENTRF